ncbi:MAG: amidohydrolase family protein [Chitinophagaceae bacterium]|nr:amidohydrolase family protein [Chitinophagaceae bacterium]MCF8421346.1 amidohydrolase family protein [Chitinophagaceae bacterium]
MRQFVFLFMLLTSLYAEAQKSILLKCGKLLDTKTGIVLEKQFVLLNGNRVVSVGPTAFKADSTIDLSDYFVMPGMIDCHTHVLLQGDITQEDYDVQVLKESIPYRTIRGVKSAERALMNGFTTIRDLGTEGAGYADVDLKKAINAGVIPGPRMLVATLAINTTGHYPIKTSEYAWELKMPKGVQEITGADEARRAVREQLEHGADWIKIYSDRGYIKQPDGNYRALSNFTLEEMNAIGSETIGSRKNFAAHAMTRDGIIAAVNAGAKSIEHGLGMDEESMQLMAAKGVFWCPTLFVNEFVAEGRAKLGSPINLMFSKSIPETFKKAVKLGVKIAYGTDIGGYDWSLPQAKDFSYFVSWGLTSIQAIQTATVHAAELLGQVDQIGEIKTGALADIIALKQDPTKNIESLQNIDWIMKDGKVYKQHK